MRGPNAEGRSATARSGFRRQPCRERVFGAVGIGLVAVFAAPASALGVDRGEQAEIDVHRLERLGIRAAGDVGDKGAHRGLWRRRGKRLDTHLCHREAARKQAHSSAFDIALDPGDLPGKANIGARFQPQLVVEQSRRIQERVAMDAAKAGKTGVLQSRNHLENRGLRTILHLGLEADDIVKRPQRIVAAQLHHGVGLYLRIMGVGQADRLHRAKAQRLAPPIRHHLDRQAAIKIARCLALVKLGLFGGKQRVDEGLILHLGHRAVHVGGLFFLGFALVIARLHPSHRHIDAFRVDDGRNSVEEGKRGGARLGADRFGEGAGGQRAGGDDPVSS
ncbi:hypothetical protein GALL_519340 [mine drainage metagenome]|uniref:Uncharacterized protein n=1 Tax=mine drainage metagenome TaxID=410659 RepID=A0A1J5P5M1_9ZZZZ